MSMLQNLPKIVHKSAKRLGRGVGSGKGEHTVGRGTKGQRARKSGEAPAWFEGGQLPLIKRLPMQRGKSRLNVLVPSAEVSLTDLQGMKAEVITLESLKLEKVIHPRFTRAKVIANGTLSRSVTIQGLAISKTAATMVEQAGGKIQK